MSHKKNHEHDNHNQHDKKKSAEMKTPETPKEDALFAPDDLNEHDAAQTYDDAAQKINPLTKLELELHQANDRALRAFAELDNYRKRASRELEEIRKYAGIDLIRDLLAVWDNMGRAIEAVEKTHDVKTLTEGVQMMHEQFERILKQHHCERIAAIGQPFDPNVHESIAQMPCAEQSNGTVLFESQIGFKLHDRVVRPTQVVLVSNPQQ